ncbi:MAG: quinolinate synthase NadA [Chloroflexaceae bacterium]|nr:quinolinate synthase NadA [Chloroflexaceae bacterium]
MNPQLLQHTNGTHEGATHNGTAANPDLIAEIMRLKHERNAVLLAHNYQYPEIQDIADFVGDSLGLSQTAASTPADVIVFCGVHFMAETAAILCPEKTVLIPDQEAGCSLAASISIDELREWKASHPDAVVVSYVNTTAEVKVESDYCCTSSNAVQIVESIPPDRTILFLPDIFLGDYVRRMTGRSIHVWPGSCHVHAAIRPNQVTSMRSKHPDADFLIHPECGCVTSCMSFLANGDIDAQHTHILSTEGMIRHSQQSTANSFIVATEVGVLHRMQKANPDREFLPIDEAAICRYMKMITLEKILVSLQEMRYQVTVPEHIAQPARQAIERMLTLV